MSRSITGSSRRYHYTEEWLKSNSSNGVTINAQLAHDEDEEGLAGQIYSLCRSVLRDLCSQEQDPHLSRPQSLLLREELTKLYLWGQGFRRGELDTALEHSDDARDIVLDTLGDVGRSLLRGKISEIKKATARLTGIRAVQMGISADIALAEKSRRSNPVLNPAHAHQQSQELKYLEELKMKYLIEQARTITSNQGEKDGEAGSDDCHDTDGDSASNDEETSDIVQELSSHIHYLVELGPTLQQNLVYAQKARIKSYFPPVVPFHLSDPAKIYVSLVREKYRNAQDQLVDRLGESNWQRHKLVREQMENVKRHPEEEHRSVEKEEDALYSAFRPFSTFHDSGIGTSVPSRTEYASSHTSFQSSNTEGEERSTRVPPTPEEVGDGKPFQCTFCGSTLQKIKNRVDWKLHVFADLRPYICTFANCEKELAQFPTRAAWADHEFTEHRVLRSWSCPECPKQCDSEIEWVLHLEKCHQRTFLGPKHQVAKEMAYKTRAKPAENEECPLCQVILGKPRREFVKHVGRHMEEIALMALPRDNDGESEIHSTSTESEFAPSATPVAQGSEIIDIDPGGLRFLQGSESIVVKNVSTDGQAPRGPSAPISTPTQPFTSTYWSVAEQTDFQNLVQHFGTDWHAIASHMKSKTHTMVKNYYVRLVEQGKTAIEQAAKAADKKIKQGDDIGPPPPPITKLERRYEPPQIPSQGNDHVTDKLTADGCESVPRINDENGDRKGSIMGEDEKREIANMPRESKSRRFVFSNIPTYDYRGHVLPQHGIGTIESFTPGVHVTDKLTTDGCEYVPRMNDEIGDRKISIMGDILGGREFKVRTFSVANRGEKKFMLATECARVLSYRDSFLLFSENSSLYKIIANQAEKDDLISRDILPYSYRSRQITLVTAKSIFRQFGARVIAHGRSVRDDYWEENAIARRKINEDMANSK